MSWIVLVFIRLNALVMFLARSVVAMAVVKVVGMLMVAVGVGLFCWVSMVVFLKWSLRFKVLILMLCGMVV